MTPLSTDILAALRRTKCIVQVRLTYIRVSCGRTQLRKSSESERSRQELRGLENPPHSCTLQLDCPRHLPRLRSQPEPLTFEHLEERNAFHAECTTYVRDLLLWRTSA